MTEKEANKNIEILNKMQELSVNPPKDVEAAKVSKTPLESVEEDLATFTRDNFALISNESEWIKEVEAELRSRFGLSEKDGGLSANQLIALLTNEKVNFNDRVSKLLGPTFQLMTARQQAETAAKQAELKNPNITINNGSPSSYKNMNENIDQEVLQGMTALNNLNKLLSGMKNAKENAEDVTPEKENS